MASLMFMIEGGRALEVVNSIIGYDEYDPASTFAAAIRKIEVE